MQKLGQLLQEQQEPFSLKSYLHEKGYPKTGKNSKKNIRQCSKIIREVCRKLNYGIHESHSKGGLKSIEKVAESDRIRSDSSIAITVSKEINQLSPVSVLDQTIDDEDKKLPASVWQLLNLNQVAELVGLKSKIVSQQRRELLFDCVMEVVNTYQQERKQLVGELICEKIRCWGNLSGDETSITRILKFDYLASMEQWSEFQLQNREIALEIGDAILETINDEILAEMLDIYRNL